VNPVLLRGQQIVVHAAGFAPRAQVAIRLANTVQYSYAAADGTGTLTLRYTVDSHLADGAYVLTFVGAPGASPSGTPQEHDVPPLRDDSPFVFLVPRVWLFHFRVTASGGDTHPPPPGTGGIAYTGVDIAALIALGAVVLVIGVLVLRTARRRS
jgi:hypothetical protein